MQLPRQPPFLPPVSSNDRKQHTDLGLLFQRVLSRTVDHCWVVEGGRQENCGVKGEDGSLGGIGIMSLHFVSDSSEPPGRGSATGWVLGWARVRVLQSQGCSLQ